MFDEPHLTIDEIRCNFIFDLFRHDISVEKKGTRAINFLTSDKNFSIFTVAFGLYSLISKHCIYFKLPFNKVQTDQLNMELRILDVV